MIYPANIRDCNTYSFEESEFESTLFSEMLVCSEWQEVTWHSQCFKTNYFNSYLTPYPNFDFYEDSDDNDDNDYDDDD